MDIYYYVLTIKEKNINMRIKLLTILLALASIPAFASVTTGVGYSSDYIWRGQSQSNGSGSLNADITVDSTNGFYASAWISQVDFGDDTASFEYDLFGGFAFSASDNLSFDVGVIQYRYDYKSIETVEEAYFMAHTALGSFSYFVDTDNSDKDYMVATLNVPFIDSVDVAFKYGKFNDDSTWKGLTFDKSFGNIDLTLLVMDDAKNGKFTDNVSLGLYYNL
jgi:uncharacterized protein (TIGR02001 family)|tara:strand:+ start:793 stop:1455 length:663 start_codon:yes stop_codon:yes gene_type:complete